MYIAAKVLPSDKITGHSNKHMLHTEDLIHVYGSAEHEHAGTFSTLHDRIADRKGGN